jgi:AcrR family transcriptional regulator
MTQLVARGSATRNANMVIRRDRILDAARTIIAESGFDALSLRDLAQRAEVTVPTIYNLIGNKAAVVAQLFNDSITPFEHLQYINDQDDPVGSPERFFDTLIASLGDNEHYHRAEFLARERFREAGDEFAISIHERVVQIAIEACAQARDAGLLKGSISARQLGEQIDHHVRLAFHDWAHGSINLKTFRSRLLVGTYLCLAADAHNKYHEQFVEKIRQHDSPPHLLNFERR